MHFDKKLNQNNRGFTLIELIITVVILALVTAPFLSSFVTASNTNVKSKRIQEANELGQYIIEQFKASSVAQLVTAYGMTVENNPDGTKKYTGTLGGGSGVALPLGYASPYEADITMTTSSSIINTSVTPVLEKIDQDECAVFADFIYKYDSSYTTASSRDVSVDVTYDAGAAAGEEYQVTLTVAYKDWMGITISGSTKTKTVKFGSLPSVYILYTPLTASDKISVKNSLSADKFVNSAGEDIRMNVHIIKQAGFDNIQPNQVNFTETSVSGSVNGLDDLISGTRQLTYTTIYTNIGVISGDIDNLNTGIKTIKIESLYNLEVKIKYSGKEISTFTATKNTFG